jgi:hypothetical protein
MALSKQLQRIREVIMTIKQQGGVFGRNPTFNDVTIEGTLTFDGDIDINSDLKVNGDLDVIGDISGTDLDLSSATGPVLNLKNTDTNGNSGEYVGKIEFEGSDASGGAAGVRAGVYAQYGSDFGFTSLDFQTAASGGAASSKMQIDGNGSIYVMNGNVIMSTSGSGIDFSATDGTGTSELFDDYEEGTWTPVLTVNGFFGGPTLSSSVATYTKVGRVVHATCRLVMSAATDPSVYCQITATPVVSDVGTNFVGVYDGSNPGSGTQGGVLTMGPAGIYTTPMGTTNTSTTWNFTVTYAVN